MATVILDSTSGELQPLLAARKRSGMDRFDEVWQGDLHVVPAPLGEHAAISQQLAEILGPMARARGLFATIAELNIGTAEDFRVPDGSLHAALPRGIWHATAALVLEIVSPHDETWAKLPFYAKHGVNELLIVDPKRRGVHWLELRDGRYRRVERSALVGLGAEELAEMLNWP